MNLKNIRQEIDKLDNKIILDLEKRIELAMQTKAYKDIFLDPKREQDILSKIKDPYITNIYKAIFKNIRDKASSSEL